MEENSYLCSRLVLKGWSETENRRKSPLCLTINWPRYPGVCRGQCLPKRGNKIFYYNYVRINKERSAVAGFQLGRV